MERAGRGVVEAVFEEWPELGQGDRRAVVLCGPGNNGGDGLAAARHLVNGGHRVDVLLFGAEDRLSPDAATNLALARAFGIGANAARMPPIDGLSTSAP